MTPEDIERKLREDVAELTQPMSPEARAIEEQLRREVNELFTFAGWSTPFAARAACGHKYSRLTSPKTAARVQAAQHSFVSVGGVRRALVKLLDPRRINCSVSKISVWCYGSWGKCREATTKNPDAGLPAVQPRRPTTCRSLVFAMTRVSLQLWPILTAL